MEQLEPQSAAYNICRASRLVGNLNISALQASLNEISSRHETLRTVFRLVDSRPVQLVQPARNISIEIADLRSMSREERNSEIQRRIKAESECPFDLSAGQLLRCSLLRIGDQEHVLILMTHHSVSDAWSMGILTRELWTLYEAFSNGKPSPLELFPVQYSDYAVWQRNWLQSEVLDTQLTYWKKQLENISILTLPSDRPRAPRQSFRGARVPITLPQALTGSVNELSSRCALTPFMTLLAAFQVLLFRYTGQDDIVIGSPIANRRRPEIEGLIGFFVNTLVLRANLSGNPSFRELLSRVKDTCVAADANQDLPFEKLVQELQLERDLSRNPLFQVMFVLQNATRPFSGIPGLRVEPIELEPTRSPFDLSLFLREREGKYTGYLDYNTDLFNRDRIERMAGHFQTLLEAIVADPDQSITTLSILAEAERHQILVEWNDTAADYPKDKCIHQLFEAQVERTPEAIALEFDGEELTYRALNRRANQLAHYLIRLGIGPEKLVGICVERSIEMVVGLLGILKSGGAYVPLDPRYPHERVGFMMDDSQISALLIRKKFLSSVCYRGLTIPLDDPQVCWHEHEENPKNVAMSDAPAYVIYTSGSTGIPKGVIGTHRGAVNRFVWMWRRFPLEANEKGCVKTSLSFVDSVWELFGPMLHGVRIVLIPDDVVQDIPRFVQELAQRRITRIVLVPSLLQSILDTVPDILDRLPDLKIWSSSGESLSKELADQFRTHLPGRKLLNLYGSSEVAADVTFYDCCDRAQGSNMRIGRPINNTQIYILDSGMQPVPIGVPGEIYVGGAGLARGYLNRPELTNEKFIENPFNTNAKSRLYRTGDLAHYRPDGNIEFLGRLDNQVKVRGYRIELGEIESAIIQHPGIEHCVVIVQNKPFGSDQIVGYIVPMPQLATPVGEVRRFIARKLPEYMVPSQFVVLERLPLTFNGKVDRNALTPANWVTPQLTRGLVEPRTEMEELIAQIWRDILKLERIGIHDNFFELGGHSLLAVQIVSKLCFASVKQLSLRVFFENPTVARLAQALESSVYDGDAFVLPPIKAVSHKGAIPLSISQEPFFIVDFLIGGAAFMNMPYAYRLSGQVNVQALRKAIQEIVDRHETLRTVFDGDEDAPVQIVRRAKMIRLSFTNLSRLSPDKKEEKLQRLSKEDASKKFDLTKAPLLRSKLVRLEPNEYVLFVTMHHIVSDQWSMGVFRKELGILYDAFVKGQPSPLPEPSLQFVDFVIWQKQMLNEGLFNEQIDYWTKQLAMPLARLDFQKRQKRRRKRIRFRSSRRPIKFDLDLYKAVKEFARRENSTPFMVFLTALNILLHVYTGEDDIRVGTLVANRGRAGTEEMIGYLVNELILRNFVSDAMSCGDLLDQVRGVCIDAYARQDLPFDYLESLLNEDWNRDAPPLCQVMFNYRNFPIPAQEFTGITLASWDGQGRAVDPGVMISRLDLMIHLRETSTKLTGAVNYKTDLFSDAAVAELLTAFDRITRVVIGSPERTVMECAAEVGGRHSDRRAK